MTRPILIQTEDADLNPAEKRETGQDKGQDKGQIQLINEGAYGCIYHPGISCRGTQENPNYITKIQKSTNITDNEKAISDIIRDKIPGYDRYFAPIVKQCNVKIARRFIPDIQKCKVFQNDTEEEIESSTYVSNKVRYLGKQTIQDYFIRLAQSPDFWSTLIETHLRLLEIVEALLDADLIHMDLKPNNVIIDQTAKTTARPIVIDFGISIHRANFDPQKAFYVYDTYTPWCIDIVLCNYSVHRIANAAAQTVSSTDIDEALNVFKYGAKTIAKVHSSTTPIHNRVFSTTLFSQEDKNALEESIRGYLKQTYVDRKSTWAQLYSDMVSRTYTTWDNYSLSLLYMEILESVYLQIEMTPFLRPYLAILKSTVYVEPPKRLSIADTRKALVQLLVQVQEEEEE